MQLPGDSAADARMARAAGVLDWLPWVLVYPLRGYCLPVLLMITVFTTFGLKSDPMGTGFPLTGIPLLAITASWSVLYLVGVIRHSARGHAMPPALGGEAAFFVGGLKPLFLPALFANFFFLLKPQRPEAAQALLILAFAILPAYLFILATEENLLHAINPLRWIETMLRMGLPYFAAVALLATGLFALRWISGTIGLSLLVALMAYTLFALAHLLGYIGFRRHRRLGLHVEVRHPDVVSREREHAEQLDRLLARIEAGLHRGDVDAALRAVEAESGGPLSPRRFFEELFQRLMTRGEVNLIHAAGRRLITLLLAGHRADRALDIAEQCLNRHPGFEPRSAGELEVLAREALARKYPELLERLLRDIERRYPGDPVVVTAHWLRAQYLAEHRNDEAGALALLQPALAHTAHPQHARIKAYARALAHLAERRP